MPRSNREPGSTRGSAPNSIIIPQEDDNSGTTPYRLEKLLHELKESSRYGRRKSNHEKLVDLTQDDESREVINTYEKHLLHEIEGVTEDERDKSRGIAAPSRNRSPNTRRQLPSFRHRNMLLKEGTTVEVSPRPFEQYSWEFLQITGLYAVGPSNNNVLIQGIRLTRTRNLRYMLPRMKNEVCALHNLSKEDEHLGDMAGFVELPVSDVIKTRVMYMTNAAFPKHRFDPDDWDRDIKKIEDKAHLVQRWKFYRYWPTSLDMRSKKSYSGALIRLRSADIKDEDYRVDDSKLRNEFRGGITRGGSSINDRLSKTTIDLDVPCDDEDDEIVLGRNQKYTVDDMFCGAGGASCGQEKAGFQVNLACDLDRIACATHRRNFPNAILRQMNIFDFIKLVTPIPYADVLHLSPPCQVWSPAHTHAGQNDEANIAALFACGEVLQQRRPRIGTGEQTFGLLFDRNEEFFNALVCQYTELGYSFRWDILKFKDYGVASIRRRLIWIASCPGEPLPTFPAPTHSHTDRRLPAPVTLGAVLASIPRGSERYDPHHNINQVLSVARNSGRFPRSPYSDNCQVGTITTAGSEWFHPSGERDFTLRELACIQGFPRYFIFEGGLTQIKRQIGNAFPSIVVEILYCYLRDCLLREDRVVARQSTSQSGIIDLDSVDDEVAIIERIVIDDSDESIDEVVDDSDEYIHESSRSSRESSCTLAESIASLMEIDDPRY